MKVLSIPTLTTRFHFETNYTVLYFPHLPGTPLPPFQQYVVRSEKGIVVRSIHVHSYTKLYTKLALCETKTDDWSAFSEKWAI